jgi:hypothetical protein
MHALLVHNAAMFSAGTGSPPHMHRPTPARAAGTLAMLRLVRHVTEAGTSDGQVLSHSGLVTAAATAGTCCASMAAASTAENRSTRDDDERAMAVVQTARVREASVKTCVREWQEAGSGRARGRKTSALTEETGPETCSHRAAATGG